MTKIKKKCQKCRKRAKVIHECRTCIALKEAGKRDEVFETTGCAQHAEEALQEIKKHALLAHPSNLLRASVAALKGEDVF